MEENQDQKNNEAQKVSFEIKTGEINRLVYNTPVLHIRIPINPETAENNSDSFKLTSADGKYDKTLTVKDDKVDGDDFVDLVYEGLKVSQKYTLEVKPGAEGSSYKLFEDVPYHELVDYYSLLEEGDELEEAEDEDSGGDEEGKDPDWEDEEDGTAEYGGKPGESIHLDSLDKKEDLSADLFEQDKKGRRKG